MWWWEDRTGGLSSFPFLSTCSAPASGCKQQLPQRGFLQYFFNTTTQALMDNKSYLLWEKLNKRDFFICRSQEGFYMFCLLLLCTSHILLVLEGCTPRISSHLLMQRNFISGTKQHHQHQPCRPVWWQNYELCHWFVLLKIFYLLDKFTLCLMYFMLIHSSTCFAHDGNGFNLSGSVFGRELVYVQTCLVPSQHCSVSHSSDVNGPNCSHPV